MLAGYDVLLRKVVENGKPIFPEAFCITEEERLEALKKGRKLDSIERLKSSNRNKFYGQYLNDPLDEENLEFKREWFQSIPNNPDIIAKLQSVKALISIDPAFRLSQQSDFTGICVTKTTPDNLVYVLEAKGIKVTPKGLVDEIFMLIDRYPDPIKVLIETVTAQVMLLDLLQDEMKRRNKWFLIEQVKPDANTTKAVRIRGLIPNYANRQIFHAPGMDALEQQLIEFPKGANDDIIDALAYQRKYWHGISQSTPVQDTPEGSYAWWQKKSHKRPDVIGKLFRDLRR